MKNLKINYPSVSRFQPDLAVLKAGKIFIPAKKPFPQYTKLDLQITLPGIEQVYKTRGLVVRVLDQPAEAQGKKPNGMLINLTDGFEDMFSRLIDELNRHDEYSEALAGIRKKQEPLTWEWILEAIAQGELEIEEEIEPEIEPPPPQKKELTPQERLRAQSVADFILNMIKAMLRSGYYDPDHPASRDSKKGLFQEFQACIGSAHEIMIGKEEVLAKLDIIVTGILDEPVSVQNIVGVGRAELFVPKLNEYFNRKSLISLAIKKHISQEQFDNFIDIMCDPRADQAKDTKVGETLTNAFIRMKVTDISTVFMDDMIALEMNLPWRVEMAIQRLAKDLKILPLYEGKSEDEIRSMKKQIIEDILRPLRHPSMLADIVINCYLIALHIEDLDAQDLEQIIIGAFPFPILLPTSRFIFNELDKLMDDLILFPENKILKRRLAAVKRILKLTAKRVVREDAPGAQKFLERLYFNDILAYEELTPEVQFRINNIKLARDIKANTRNYVNWINEINTPEDAVVLLKSFKRAVPILIEHESWPTLIEITRELQANSSRNKHFQSLESGGNPLVYIYRESTEELTEAFTKGDPDKRQDINGLFVLLGEFGVELLCRILEESNSQHVLEAAVDVLKTQEDHAKPWVYGILDDHQKPAHLHCSGLIILSEVGQGDEDINRMRWLLRHGAPHVRQEALKTALALKAGDSELLIVQALQDKDPLVQKQALSCLRDRGTLKNNTIDKIIEVLQVEQPDTRDEIIAYCRKRTIFIKSLGILKDHPKIEEIEEALLNLLRKQCEGKKFFKFFRRVADQELCSLFSNVLNALIKIGSTGTVTHLKKLSPGDSPYSELVDGAVTKIQDRLAANSSMSEKV